MIKVGIIGGAGYTAEQKEIRATAEGLKNTPLLCGVIPEPWHLYLRQKSAQVPIAKLAAGLVGGGKGFLVYNLPGCDGRSFTAFSRFCSLLADYEDVLYDGKRSNAGATVKGIPQEHWTLFTLNGKPRILVCFNKSNDAADISIETPFKQAREYFTGKEFANGKAAFVLNAGDMAALILE